MEQWYYADARRQQQGPVTGEVVAGKFRQGELTADTLVWRDGLAGWEPLSAHSHALGLDAPPAPAVPVEPPAPPTTPVEPAPADYTPVDPSPVEASPVSPATQAPVSVTADAPQPEPAPDTLSPYAAPAAPLYDAGSAVVHGGDIVHAGFWKRVAAYTIDSFIVGIVGGVIGAAIGMVIGLGAASAGDDTLAGASMLLLQVVVNLASIALAATYYAGFHASANRATLGKLAVGIKVVRTDGQKITFLRGVGRYFGAMLSGLILCIGFVMAAFTERKQALHDMLCDTLVVDKWAFTEHPEWQQRNLGTVTIVVLVLLGLMLVVGGLALLALIGILASSFS